jgi:hypothetical protein
MLIAIFFMLATSSAEESINNKPIEVLPKRIRHDKSPRPRVKDVAKSCSGLKDN